MAETETETKAPSKMQLVRDLLKDNAKATPKELQTLLKEKHGIDMSTAMISNYKTSINKPKGSGKKAAKPTVMNRLPKASTNGVSNGIVDHPAPEATFELDDIAAIAELKRLYGKDVLHRLRAVLSK